MEPGYACRLEPESRGSSAARADVRADVINWPLMLRARRRPALLVLLLVGTGGLLGDVTPARACSLPDSLWVGYPATTSPLPGNHRPLVLGLGVPEPRVATDGPAPAIERFAPPDGSDLFPFITRVTFADPGPSRPIAYTITDPRGLAMGPMSSAWYFDAPADHDPPRFPGARQLELRATPDECTSFGPPGTLYARLAWERPSEPLLVRIFSVDARGQHRLARGVVADLSPTAPLAHSAIVRLAPGLDPAQPICLLALAEDMAGNPAPAATICCALPSGPGAGSCAPIAATASDAGLSFPDAAAEDASVRDAGATPAIDVGAPTAAPPRPSQTGAGGCSCRVTAPAELPGVGTLAAAILMFFSARSARRARKRRHGD